MFVGASQSKEVLKKAITLQNMIVESNRDLLKIELHDVADESYQK